MKKILTCIQFLLLAIAANATGQEGDIIYIDGTRWELLGRPVSRDSVLYHHLKAVLPSNRSISTANWDGFTAYWSIVQDVLCLDSIRCEHYDANCREYIGERIHPELTNIKRINFSIKNARVDSQGNLVECEVKVLNPNVRQQLAEEMARLLKAYRPWRVSFINGEYRADGIAHWAFPYLLDK